MMKNMKKGWISAIALLLGAICLLCSCNTEGGTPETPMPSGYGVVINEVTIEIDAVAEPVLDAMGERESYDESPTCAFEGMDKVYGYGSFEIKTYTLGGVEYIHSIYLLDDTWSTREGLTIGDSRDKAEKLYGEFGIATDAGLMYDLGDVRLTILLNTDGKVTNIQYVKEEN